LPGDQGMISDEHRRPPFLDNLHIFRFQILFAGRDMLGFMTIGLNVLAL
jgi:hypothetical protein